VAMHRKSTCDQSQVNRYVADLDDVSDGRQLT
jgi:hypothetical protein